MAGHKHQPRPYPHTHSEHQSSGCPEGAPLGPSLAGRVWVGGLFHESQHLANQLRGHDLGLLGRIVDRRHFHEIAANNVHVGVCNQMYGFQRSFDVMPPASAVPVPGAADGSSTSMSMVT